MSKRKPRIYNPVHLVEAIEKWPNPIYDKKHGYYIYVNDNRARSNETRTEHIVEYGHDLKARDLKSYLKELKTISCLKRILFIKTHITITLIEKEKTKDLSRYQSSSITRI